MDSLTNGFVGNFLLYGDLRSSSWHSALFTSYLWRWDNNCTTLDHYGNSTCCGLKRDGLRYQFSFFDLQYTLKRMSFYDDLYSPFKTDLDGLRSSSHEHSRNHYRQSRDSNAFLTGCPRHNRRNLWFLKRIFKTFQIHFTATVEYKCFLTYWRLR